jgi:hypothetical protein
MDDNCPRPRRDSAISLTFNAREGWETSASLDTSINSFVLCSIREELVRRAMPDLAVRPRILDWPRDAAPMLDARGLTGSSIDVGEQQELHVLQLVPRNRHGLIDDEP